jgi:MFS transporter, DHA1 family, inner membrane transport protein
VPLLLFALFIATFGIGTTEFAIVGVLPDVASDLDVSISQAGLLVSGYALGVAIGGPAIVMLMASQPRKKSLLQLVCIFVVGHALTALAPDYGLLMAARILAAISHASFLGIAAVVAAASVPPERSARAVSLVWLGFSAASLVGVPGVTALGHELGWRAAFWALTVVGVVAGVTLQIWMPRTDQNEQPSLSRELVALRRPQVLLAMAMSLFVCASTFVVFTFVAPLLLNETHIQAGALPIMLFLFGVGGTAGMFVGGRLGDWNPLLSVIVLLLVHAVVYLCLMVLIDNLILVGLLMALWGFLFLAPCVPLQTRVVREAIGGPNLASTLNQSAFNVGNAIGPSLGAGALALGFGYRTLPVLGVLLALACAATALISLVLERSAASRTQPYPRETPSTTSS